MLSFSKDELKTVLLIESGLDNRLIKVLARWNIKTVEDILNHESLGEKLSPQLAKEFNHLIDSFYEDSDEFIRLMTREKTGPVLVQKTSVLKEPPSEPISKTSRKSDGTKAVTFGTCYPLPSTNYAVVLKEFEKDYSQILDTLCQDNHLCLIFELFDDPVRLDEMSEAFRHLFAGYINNQDIIAPMIEGNLPNSYIIFVAWRTRERFSHNNLWGNFFNEYGLIEHICIDLKKLFMMLLEKRSLITYTPEEKTDYMFSTALLHGGLGKEHWEDLWQRCLFPLARQVASERSLEPLYASGHGVLSSVLNLEAGCSPKAATLSVLRKMSVDSAAAVLQRAFDLAFQVVCSQRSQNGGASRQAVALADDLLPSVAIETLSNAASVLGVSESNALPSSGRSEVRVLPKPFLGFNEDCFCPVGVVNRTELSAELLGKTVQFIVNGTVVDETVVSKRGGRCILNGFEVQLAPAPEYHFELKVLEGNASHAGEYSDITNVIKPRISGLWEFVPKPSGMWTQRSIGGTGRPHKVLYMSAPGNHLVFDGGAEVLGLADCKDAWDGWEVCVARISPGARGRLLDGRGEAIDTWYEAISAEVIHPGRIGQTASGKDLFVDYRIADSSGRNGALPVIAFTASFGTDILSHLNFRLTVDGGRELPVPAASLSMHRCGEDVQQLEINLRRADGFPHSAEECVLTVWLDDEKFPVYRYKFGIAPIKGFHLSQTTNRGGAFFARYEFIASDGICILNDSEEKCLCKNGKYVFQAPLESTKQTLAIRRDDGRVMVFSLDLVGVKVDPPECFSGKAPCLADALQLGAPLRGRGCLKAQGSNTRCAVVGKLGDHPLLFSELSGYKECIFDVLDPALFIEESGLVQAVLSFQFGAEIEEYKAAYAWCDVVIGHCAMGFGPKSAGLVVEGGACLLKFDAPLWQDTHVVVTSVLNERTVTHAKEDLPAGAVGIEIPSCDIRRIRRYGCKVTLMANGLFGPDEEHAYEIEVRGEVYDGR